MVLQLQKRTMALAGLVMTVYLFIHMLTNLSFFNQTSFNQFYTWYNAGITRWVVLFLVSASLLIHVKAAIKIRKVNAKARMINYRQHDRFKIPAPLVTLSILFLLAFIVIHIIQTLVFDSADVYEELNQLFQSEMMVLFYLSGLFVLMMHLQHSLANVLQTLGKTSVTHSVFIWIGVLALVGGFALIPVYIYISGVLA